jgi:hypothetical protein
VETWCGLVACGLGPLVAGYQGSIVGIGAIIAAYFTIRATTRSATVQVKGVSDSTDRQIAENKKLLESELAAHRELADVERKAALDDRAMRARALTFSVIPALLEVRKKAEAMLLFIDRVAGQKQDKISRNDDTVGSLTIEVPPALIRIADELYLLGPAGGGSTLQLMALCELQNRALLQSRQQMVTPELHRAHANAVLKLCDEISAAITPIHDGEG